MINYNKSNMGRQFTNKEIQEAEANYNNTTTTMNTTAMTETQAKSAISLSAKGIEVDFAAGTLNNRTVRNFAIIRTTKLEEGKVVIDTETLINRNQLINLVAAAMTGKTATQAQAFLFNTLEQAIFTSTTGYGTPEALTDDAVRDAVADANRAYVLQDSDYGLTPVLLDGATITRLLAQTTLAVCPDKQMKKAVLIGEGANAAGVYRSNGQLTSINPIEDFTKGINRANAGFSPKANSDERIVSNVEFEAESGNFRAEGIQRKAAFFPGLAVLAQGMVGLNEGVSFDFYADKSMILPVAVATIGSKINTIEFPSILSNGNTITVNDVVIYTHTEFTTVQVNSVVPTLDEEAAVWTFKVSMTMLGLAKTNVKVRDFGCKGMTHNSGQVVVEDNSWELLFTSESMKTAEGLRTMYTQANGAHTVGVDGVLRNADGVEVTTSDIKRWYSNAGQFYTVQTPVHASNVASLEKATAGKVSFSAPNAEGICIAEQRVFGIITNYVFNIELASADEIAGFTKLDATARTIQSTLSARYAARLNRMVEKQSRKVAAIFHNGEIYNFDTDAPVLPTKAVATRILALIAEHGNVKAAFSAVANSGVDTFKIAFKANNNSWVCVFPIKAFLAFGQFDAVGNPALSATETNPIALAINFLTVAATGDLDALVAIIRSEGAPSAISKFIEVQQNKATANAMSVHSAFYAKAIADWRIPAFVGVGQTGMLPSVNVAPESPAFSTMTENEIVVLTRTPMPASVACLVRVAPFAMDANVIAVNPLIMDVNHGDCDGDAVSIASPRLAGAAVSVAEAMAFNKSVVSIGGYIQSLEVSGELSTTLEAIKEVAEMTAKTRTKFTAKYFELNHCVDETVWASTMAKVQEVYSKHVASAYDIAFNTLQQYAARSAAGEVTFSPAAMLDEAMTAWTRYEDEALCGYSAKTFEGMVDYLEGNNLPTFTSIVVEGLAAAKADFFAEGEEVVITADKFAATAFAARIIAKRYSSTEAKTARRRSVYLQAAKSSIPFSSIAIAAIANACRS